MKSARRYTVSGRVQGVGFRYFVLDVAQQLGLDGSVRNCAGGDVEVIACGTADQLAALAAELRHGPPFARVTAVEEAAAAWPEGRTGFTIEHRASG